jgi:hypothetical protein
MPILAEGNRDRPWLVAANQLDGRSHEFRTLVDAAVGPAEVLAPGRAKQARGGFALAQALVRRAVRSELADREIAEPDRASLGRVPRDRAAEADLQVVRVRTEDQQVEGHPMIIGQEAVPLVVFAVFAYFYRGE